MPKATGNTLAITLALTISGVCPGSAAQTPIDLVVQLENHAGLVSPVLADAEQLAGAVFAQIGVRLRWQEKADQANRAEDAGQPVRLLLLSESMARTKIRRENIKNDVLATSTSQGRRVWVLVNRLEIASDTYARSRSIVLGLVLAHEIGHVFLPGRSHSTTGIMQDAIIRQPLTSGFTDAEARLIRERLSAK